MYIEFQKDYLAYPKGRVQQIQERSGEKLISKGIAKQADEKAFLAYEKKKEAAQEKCKDCIEKGKECEECNKGGAH